MSQFTATAHSAGEFLGAQTSQGATLPQAFLQARPLLTESVTRRLGFVDQQSRLVWGRLVADSLRELRGRDPSLCYRAMAGQALDQPTLAQAFSAANTSAFQQAVVGIYESADRGMRRESQPGDEPTDRTQAVLEFRAIQEAIDLRFGQSVATRISNRKFPESPTEPPEALCAARIYQLEAMLKRPKPTASMLIDSVLR